jgi:hypothetical protein
MTFRELLEDRNSDQMKKIEKEFKKAGFNIGQVDGFGTQGDELTITLNIEYNTRRDAENADIQKTLKILNKLYTDIKVNKNDENYKNGVIIQSADYRKTDPSDPHEIHISYIGKL